MMMMMMMMMTTTKKAQTSGVENIVQVFIATNTWVTSYHQKVTNNCIITTIKKHKRQYCFQNNKIIRITPG
jgi:hypothetical protein